MRIKMEQPSKELLSTVLYDNRIEISSIFINDYKVEY